MIRISNLPKADLEKLIDRIIQRIDSKEWYSYKMGEYRRSMTIHTSLNKIPFHLSISVYSDDKDKPTNFKVGIYEYPSKSMLHGYEIGLYVKDEKVIQKMDRIREHIEKEY